MPSSRRWCPARRGSLEVAERTIHTAESWTASTAAPAPGTRSRAVLAFRTPLALRTGGALKGGVEGLIPSLGNRIAGLARWQDCAVEADWRSIADHARSLRYDPGDLSPNGWRRASRRQGRTDIPVEGLNGSLIIEGDLAPVWPLLALGVLCHAGGRSSLGLGRYELSLQRP